MANYQEVRVLLPNTQLNKLKFAAKNKTGTILNKQEKLSKGRIATQIISNKTNN